MLGGNRLVGILMLAISLVTASPGVLADDAVRNLPGPVVEIKVGHGICSGVYIGHGMVLTAGHCAEDKQAIAEIIFSQDDRPGIYVHGKLLTAATGADIAIFKLIEPVHAIDATLACREPVVGEPIQTVGSPLGITFIHTWGHVAGVMRNVADGWGAAVPIDIEFAPGNSGGPVFDGEGKVLGVVIGMIGERDHKTGDVGSFGSVKFMTSSLVACPRDGNQ